MKKANYENIPGKWWVLKMTFFKRNGWITQYGEMRNIDPKSRVEFQDMADKSMAKEYGKFCFTIGKARKPKDEILSNE